MGGEVEAEVEGVLLRPLAAHQPQRDGALACARAIALADLLSSMHHRRRLLKPVRCQLQARLIGNRRAPTAAAIAEHRYLDPAVVLIVRVELHAGDVAACEPSIGPPLARLFSVRVYVSPVQSLCLHTRDATEPADEVAARRRCCSLWRFELRDTTDPWLGRDKQCAVMVKMIMKQSLEASTPTMRENNVC